MQSLTSNNAIECIFNMYFYPLHLPPFTTLHVSPFPTSIRWPSLPGPPPCVRFEFHAHTVDLVYQNSLLHTREELAQRTKLTEARVQVKTQAHARTHTHALRHPHTDMRAYECERTQTCIRTRIHTCTVDKEEC